MNWEEEEDFMPSLSKFEAMLKTNKVFFFDSEEFEDIIFHYLDAGKISLAKKALKLAFEQHPKTTVLKLIEVEILIFENKFDLADRILNEIQEIEPTNEDIYQSRAVIFSKKGDHLKAIEQYKIALDYTDAPSEIYSMMGMEYLFLDDVQTAKEYFILGIKDDLTDISALYNIVYCFDFLDEHDKAVEFLNWYIDQNPYSEVAWHQLGREYYALEDYKNALRAFDYAVLIDEEFLGAIIEKGKTLEKLGQYEEAIEYFEQACSMDDPTSYIYFRIGKSHEKIGNYDLAIQNYENSIEQDPTYENAWIALVDLMASNNNLLNALDKIENALEIDPENELYWKRYASIKYTMNDYEEAYKGYEKAIEFGSSDIDVFLNYADFNIAYSSYDDAITTLLVSVEIGESLADVYYRLAGLYMIKNEEVNAHYYLNQALFVDTKYEKLEVFKELFPEVNNLSEIKNIIEKHKLNNSNNS